MPLCLFRYAVQVCIIPNITTEDFPRLSICLLLFTCNYVVSVWRGFLFLWVLGMGYVILLWHSLSLPYNYFQYILVWRPARIGPPKSFRPLINLALHIISGFDSLIVQMRTQRRISEGTSSLLNTKFKSSFCGCTARFVPAPGLKPRRQIFS